MDVKSYWMTLFLLQYCVIKRPCHGLDCFQMYNCHSCDGTPTLIMTSSNSYLPGCGFCGCCEASEDITQDTLGKTDDPFRSTTNNNGYTLDQCTIDCESVTDNNLNCWGYTYYAATSLCQLLFVGDPVSLITKDTSTDFTGMVYYRRHYCCTDFTEYTDSSLNAPTYAYALMSVDEQTCKKACVGEPENAGRLCWGILMISSTTCKIISDTDNTWFIPNLIDTTGSQVFVRESVCTVDYVPTTTTTPSTTTTTTTPSTTTTTTTPSTTTTTTTTTTPSTTTTTTTPSTPSTTATTTTPSTTTTTATPSTTSTTTTTQSTTASTSTAPNTVAPTTSTPGYCPCPCAVHDALDKSTEFNNLSPEEKEKVIQQRIEEVKKELTVDTSTLSATVRQKISAQDKRSSAKAIGMSLGIALLTVTFCLIVLADLRLLIQHVGMFFRNAKLWLLS